MPPPSALSRLHWKSRRGWLELDLLLAQFWRTRAATLTPAEATLLAQWLDMDDPHLWQTLTHPPATPPAATLAAKLRPPTA